MAVSASGKVLRLYPNESGCYIKLKYTGIKPKSSYFQLLTSHSNYNSLYSLALLAATNGHKLKIRTRRDIHPSRYGVAQYMVVDF